MCVCVRVCACVVCVCVCMCCVCVHVCVCVRVCRSALSAPVMCIVPCWQDNYTFAQPGIQRSIMQMEHLVKTIDSQCHTYSHHLNILPSHVALQFLSPSHPPSLHAVSLHRHLQSFHIEYLQFAFRWVNNLLMRELPLRLVVRLWDTYLVSTSSAKPSTIHSFSVNSLPSQFLHHSRKETGFLTFTSMCVWPCC